MSLTFLTSSGQERGRTDLAFLIFALSLSLSLSLYQDVYSSPTRTKRNLGGVDVAVGRKKCSLSMRVSLGYYGTWRYGHTNGVLTRAVSEQEQWRQWHMTQARHGMPSFVKKCRVLSHGWGVVNVKSGFLVKPTFIMHESKNQFSWSWELVPFFSV
jgi:hypothetical protein